jgi:hypothetical protein
MTNPVKGQPGGECGRLLCKCHPAMWHDSINEMSVCAGCANDINRLYRALSITEPCVEAPPPPAAAAAMTEEEYLRGIRYV